MKQFRLPPYSKTPGSNSQRQVNVYKKGVLALDDTVHSKIRIVIQGKLPVNFCQSNTAIHCLQESRLVDPPDFVPGHGLKLVYCFREVTTAPDPQSAQTSCRKRCKLLTCAFLEGIKYEIAKTCPIVIHISGIWPGRKSFLFCARQVCSVGFAP